MTSQSIPIVNARQKMDGLHLLRTLDDGTAALVNFDPQYRNVLDKLKYGNEGKGRQKRRAGLAAMSNDQIREWLTEIGRVLAPSGHCLLWCDKFILAEGKHLEWGTPELHRVDLIAWHKERMGMGRRSRGVLEYLLVLQKAPIRAKDTWTDHGIPDGYPERVDRSIHPHAKPLGLTSRLIRAVTMPGDLVVDPCAGSYVVLQACIATKRQFVGCDIKG